MDRFYPIGIPGTPWADAEKQQWFSERTIERSYHDDVVSRLETLTTSSGDVFHLAQYGALALDPDLYPLFSVTMQSSNPTAPWALITGGVHGYETSGVHGALGFLESVATSYQDRVSLLVAPCVSPWGYEVINRWNPNAIDPNRSFVENSPAQESASLIDLVANAGVDFLMHLDLHETTDTDESEFRPALAARDGESFEPGSIPDGFYTVGDTDNPQPEFQAAIIDRVGEVTHIAPPDEDGLIIGSPATQHGVINYPLRQWGLCQGITSAPFTSTTEVYPDSPLANDAICNEAQIAAVSAALDFALAHSDT